MPFSPVPQNPWEGLIRVPPPPPHSHGLVHKVILYSSELSQFPGKVCWLVQALEKSLGDSDQTRFQGFQLKYRPWGGGGGPIAFFQYKPKKLVIFQGGPAPHHHTHLDPRLPMSDILKRTAESLKRTYM